LHCARKGLARILAGNNAAIVIGYDAFRSFTRRTLADASAVRRDLEQIESRRVAYDDEEFSVGVRCLAVPIFKHDGSVATAIGLPGPSPRVTDERLKEWAVMLQAEALLISIQLGSEPPKELRKPIELTAEE
jgi:DNA-binding IclR family transcriptional regulator